ncbi:DUF6538 domain-containing protein [Motiliproteus sp. MSK22-1]|uniref:DUF6538 domain-containing protein n=1 Tax=Motiliproteus sp. MSK22-1 TaxID=1897630 RepID=UPI0035111EA3
MFGSSETCCRNWYGTESPTCLLRGRTYYFRYSIPLEARRVCPLLPIEVKRSLRTDSLSEALALIVSGK